MNWDAVAAIANIVAAAAVIASVVYLAHQVRSGAQALRLAARDSTFNSLMDWNATIIADPELGHLFQRGCRDYHALGETERARMVHVFYSFFKMFERIYLHHRHGAVESEVWLSNREMLLAYASQPGARYYLSHREKIFDAGFWRYLEENRAGDVPAGHVVSRIAPETPRSESVS